MEMILLAMALEMGRTRKGTAVDLRPAERVKKDGSIHCQSYREVSN